MDLRQSFANLGLLFKVGLKRDRVRLIVWCILMIFLFLVVALEYNRMYSTAKALTPIIALADSASMIALFGRLAHAVSYTTAEVLTWEMTMFMAILQAIMSIQIITNGTRKQEELGIIEVVRARAVGRASAFGATTLEVFGLNALLTVGYGAILQLVHVSGMTAASGWLLALGIGATGFMFGMFTLVFTQIGSTTRTVSMMAYGFFALTYVIRMLTDIANAQYTWLSPLGWIEKLDSFHAMNYWIIGLMLVVSLLLLTLASWLSLNRDVGAGLLQPRRGRAHASTWLTGSFTLVAKIEKNLRLAWVLGMFAFGAMYGSIFDSITSLVNESPIVKSLLMTDTTHSIANMENRILLEFMIVLIGIIFLVALIPLITGVMKIQADEKNGVLELIHSKPLSRLKVLWAYVGNALQTYVLAFISGILGLYVGQLAVMQHPLAIGKFIATIGAYLPAGLLVAGVLVALLGWLPRGMNVLWGYFGFMFFTLYLGGMLKFSKVIMNISLINWLGKVPITAIKWEIVALQVVLAVIFMALGALGYQKRDLG